MLEFMKRQGWTILIILLSIVFAVSGFIFLHEYYSKEISDFSVEIMAAVIGTIFTVSAMAILMRMEAPIFFLAVSSQANIGAAASAPIVASAFHPSLAPVGVLLGVAGYVIGTYAGLLCALLLKLVYTL